MKWGKSGSTVELNGASGRSWSLTFTSLIHPPGASDDAPSTVHLVKDRATSAVFALKRQVPGGLNLEVDDLIRQAAAWRQLALAGDANAFPEQFPALVDAFVIDGSPKAVAFLMEYCEGGHIPKKIGVEKAWVVANAGLAMSEACKAVGIHGAIEWSHVVLAGDSVTVKVLGFGATRAKALKAAQGHAAKGSSDEEGDDNEEEEDEGASQEQDMMDVGAVMHQLMFGKGPKWSKAGALKLPPDADEFPRILLDILEGALDDDEDERFDANRMISALQNALKKIDPPADLTPHIPKHKLGRQHTGADLVSHVTLKDILRENAGVAAGDPDAGPVSKRSSLFQMVSNANLGGTASGRVLGNTASNAMRRPSSFFGSVGFVPDRPMAQPAPPGGRSSFDDAILAATGIDAAAVPEDVAAEVLAEVLSSPALIDSMYATLFRRPCSKDPVVAYKVLTLLHLLVLEGPQQMLQACLKNDKFLEWIQTTWTAEAIQANPAGHNMAYCFAGGEISFFAAYLRMKARFHHKAAHAWTGNFARTDAVDKDGRDPLSGRERKVLEGLQELVETLAELAGKFLAGADPCKPLKVAAAMGVVIEATKAYEGVCDLVDTVPQPEKRMKFVESFESIHNTVKEIIGLTHSSPDLSARLSADNVIALDESPPDIVAMAEAALAPPDDNELEEEEARLEEERREREVRKGLKKSQLDEAKRMKEEQKAKAKAEAEAMRRAEEEAAARALVLAGTNREGQLLNWEGGREGRVRGSQVANPNVSHTETLANAFGEDMSVASMTMPKKYKMIGGDDEGDAGNASDYEDDDDDDASRPAVLKYRSEAVENAIVAVSQIEDIRKDHPPHCQCAICVSAEDDQNITQADELNSELDLQAEMKDEIPLAVIPDRPRMDPKYEVYKRDVKLFEKIGSGGFGVVYRGTYKDDEVAVKKILPSALKDKSSIEEFQSEIGVLCIVRHPNILNFYGASTYPPDFMIITEFMKRGTLFDVLHKNRTVLNWVLIKKIANDIARGMAYLHASNIIHRDLKSTNLMIGNNYSVRIGDFGLAIFTDATFGGGLSGTFQYMAPEIAAGEPHTYKSDVYSFGVVLWEILMRQLPFFGIPPDQVRNMVVQGVKPPIPPTMPRPYAMMIQACWSREPFKRPSFPRIQNLMKQMPG